MPESPIYAEILLPLPLPGTFTYLVSEEFSDQIAPGKRVEVQFGHNKVYSGLVKRIISEKPEKINPKPILSVLDDIPIVNNQQYALWDWISQYYLCYPGEVMNAALPSALKLASESKIVLNPLTTADPDSLSEREYLIYEALDIRKVLSMQDVSAILGLKKIMPVLKGLVDKGIIEIYENLQDRYIPKYEIFVQLSENYLIEENLQELFDRLERKSEKQLKCLMTYLHLSRSLKLGKIKQSLILKEADVTHAVIRAMEKKGIFILSEEIVSRLGETRESAGVDSIVFNPFQELAYTRIRHSFLEKDVVLLHGVTSSGKTELYIKLIKEVLDTGKQVLYLLPEIALTTQIISRLVKYFGPTVGVYHSKYNEQERVEVWKKVIQHSSEEPRRGFSLVLGARSALFLPFSDLGLIIVDEEHDSSYKQHEPAPRYQARDAAIILGKIHHAKVLLGSATPAIESYYNALSGRFGLVTLKERYGGVELPEIQVVDMRLEARKKQVHSHYSQVLLDHIDDALNKKEQIILFQNRRGFSLRIYCESCQWTPECKNCDVTLTYHKHRNELRCHYCGYTVTPLTRCPSCNGVNIRMSGFGTEKVEEELPVFFPNARMARMDLDSTRSKYSYQKILSDFENKNVDILIGTQMVTKGLDFDNVSLVGVLNADNQLTYPDFRSYERSFQLMAQVSGRSGRKLKRGKVIIQTWSPSHPVIEWVVANDYEKLFQEQLRERNVFHYPPYYRLIQISVKHKDLLILSDAANYLAGKLKSFLGNRVIGPEYPLVSRINLWYIKQLLIKIDRDNSLLPTKSMILQQVKDLEIQQKFRNTRVVIDVDPY
ncbi:MAG: primosomal protein N' [Bacteroidales bacterium]